MLSTGSLNCPLLIWIMVTEYIIRTLHASCRCTIAKVVLSYMLHNCVEKKGVEEDYTILKDYS